MIFYYYYNISEETFFIDDEISANWLYLNKKIEQLGEMNKRTLEEFIHVLEERNSGEAMYDLITEDVIKRLGLK